MADLTAFVQQKGGQGGQRHDDLFQDRRDALEVVSRLGLTLQLTIEKYHRDLADLKQAKSG